MSKAYKYEVSVLVLSYNPKYDDLISTLKSVLLQKDVKKQIIIADDGSKENWFGKVEELFAEYGFKDYVLVGNEVNLGITKNFYSGITKAEGEFFKGISPGDYLYSADTLSKWLGFMRKTGRDVSFGDAVYFRVEDDKIIPIEKNQNRPRLRPIYNEKKYRREAVKKSCWMIPDFILGATYFAKTELVVKYCEPLLGKVKYMEDALYRIMLLDGIETVHYPENVFMYEYGSGVSTTTNSKWVKIMDEEKKIIEKLVTESSRNDSFTKKLRKYWSRERNTNRQINISTALSCPSAFIWKLYRIYLIRSGKCFTDTKYDKEFMNLIRGTDNAGN